MKDWKIPAAIALLIGIAIGPNIKCTDDPDNPDDPTPVVGQSQLILLRPWSCTLEQSDADLLIRESIDAAGHTDTRTESSGTQYARADQQYHPSD